MSLLSVGVQPRSIWRTVQAHRLVDGDHPLGERKSWRERPTYVQEQPDVIARLFHDRDMEFEAKGIHFFLLFDALDRCSDDWTVMYRLIRGLLRHAFDMHSYRRLRVKVFLRSDQVDESRIADFPDASKVLSSAVQLNWPRRELYGLLWHHLANGPNGGVYRKFLWNEQWDRRWTGKPYMPYRDGWSTTRSVNAEDFTSSPVRGWEGVADEVSPTPGFSIIWGIRKER